MATFGRGFLTYAGTILLFCILVFGWQIARGGFEDIGLFPLFVFGTSLMVGLWAIVPTFAIWAVVLLLLSPTGLTGRWRAVVSVVPTAFLGALVSAHTFGEVFGSMGARGTVGIVEHSTVTLLATLVAYWVWTVLPEETSSDE